jgi:hypothetical protein
MNNSVSLKENDGKYSVIKQGGKRALRVFKSKQEALDYIKSRNLSLIEETMDIIVTVPPVPPVPSVDNIIKEEPVVARPSLFERLKKALTSFLK